MISLVYTTYNRTQLLLDSFRQIVDHEFISEIVIVDDYSDMKAFEWLLWHVGYKFTKVKIFRNASNYDCYRNKREAISKANNEWCILADSDNGFDKPYVDRCEQLWLSGLNPRTVYQPSFARPHFNFQKWEGHLIDKGNVAKFMVDPTFSTMLNASNYFVNKHEYLRVWDGSIDPVTSDSIYQNYNWFKAGNSMYVVPGLEYTHRIDDHGTEEPSHYARHVRRTPNGFHRSIEQKLRELK